MTILANTYNYNFKLYYNFKWHAVVDQKCKSVMG